MVKGLANVVANLIGVNVDVIRLLRMGVPTFWEEGKGAWLSDPPGKPGLDVYEIVRFTPVER